MDTLLTNKRLIEFCNSSKAEITTMKSISTDKRENTRIFSAREINNEDLWDCNEEGVVWTNYCLSLKNMPIVVNGIETYLNVEFIKISPLYWVLHNNYLGRVI